MFQFLQGGPKKVKRLIGLEENYLRNFKICYDGVFLFIYSHPLKKLDLSKLFRKKVMGL